MTFSQYLTLIQMAAKSYPSGSRAFPPECPELIPGCIRRAKSISIVCFIFSSRWKGIHGMSEVVTTKYFLAWLHDRKVISTVKASSGRFNFPFLSSNFHSCFHGHSIEIYKKLLALFSAPKCFSPSEIYWRKDVINSPLSLKMTCKPARLRFMTYCM